MLAKSSGIGRNRWLTKTPPPAMKSNGECSLKRNTSPWVKHLEIGLAPGSPKIYLVGLSLGEKPKPLVIGDSNEKLHEGIKEHPAGESGYLSR